MFIELQLALVSLGLILSSLQAQASNEIFISREAIYAEVTAYSSTPDQTDETPFITASGSTTQSGIIANNCLKFGTKVSIGDEIYIVQDRMNKRYDCSHYDIWFPDRSSALEWGRQKKDVIIL